ncbi:hypothetical protein EV382_5276 [Micromonospora violae]|uniref:Alpha/beta hydrolase n=2 Tax=Micromonospora violae TaxID=1278207 RepID=A0A4Q7UQ74_9ACTN|nr:hypothetical protein EV382_5276 [Micromonospora violae]
MTLAALATAAVAAALLNPISAAASAASTSSVSIGVPPGAAQRVESVRYNLGDQAFKPPAEIGYVGDNELNGVVYYPKDLGRGTHPLIMIEHGYWGTCADRDAERRQNAAIRARDAATAAGNTAEVERQEKIINEMAARLWGWPCRSGVPQLPSLVGYEYLGRQLAAAGFVVVSIGTNGINANDPGQADTTFYNRAALINKQLEMWQQLSTTGRGPLRGSFVDPQSGRHRDVDFRGHVDLTRVGTIGHSRGGGGVMQQAADVRRDQWPAGVQVKAVFGLAPVFNWNGEAVTRTPFAVMWGTCDSDNSGSYFEDNVGANRVPIYKYTLTGGNHDSFNTQWSPSSGQVGSRDDAEPGSRPGYCRSQFPGDDSHRDQKALTEEQQRRIATAYASAFFLRHLQGQRQYDPVLNGVRRLPNLPDAVQVKFAPPVAR